MSEPGVSSRMDRAIDVALWSAGALFAGVTLVFSLFVVPPQSGALAVSDKSLHIASYFATGLCLLLAAVWRPGRGDGPFPTWGVRGAVALIAAGAAIEIVQGVFTSRHAEIADVFADIIGVSAALLVHGLVRRVAGDRPR